MKDIVAAWLGFITILSLGSMFGQEISVVWMLVALVFSLSLYTQTLFKLDFEAGVLVNLKQLGALRRYLWLKMRHTIALASLTWLSVLVICLLGNINIYVAFLILSALPALVVMQVFLASLVVASHTAVMLHFMALVFLVPLAMFCAGGQIAIASNVVPVAAICYNLAASIFMIIILPRVTEYALAQATD